VKNTNVFVYDVLYFRQPTGMALRFIKLHARLNLHGFNPHTGLVQKILRKAYPIVLYCRRRDIQEVPKPFIAHTRGYCPLKWTYFRTERCTLGLVIPQEKVDLEGRDGIINSVVSVSILDQESDCRRTPQAPQGTSKRGQCPHPEFSQRMEMTIPSHLIKLW